MKEFSCGDVIPGCKAEFSFATTDELLSAVAAHAMEAHGINEVTPALADEVMSKIRTI